LIAGQVNGCEKSVDEIRAFAPMYKIPVEIIIASDDPSEVHEVIKRAGARPGFDF